MALKLSTDIQTYTETVILMRRLPSTFFAIDGTRMNVSDVVRRAIVRAFGTYVHWSIVESMPKRTICKEHC